MQKGIVAEFGIRKGLKIPRAKAYTGSIPVDPTKKIGPLRGIIAGGL